MVGVKRNKRSNDRRSVWDSSRELHRTFTLAPSDHGQWGHKGCSYPLLPRAACSPPVACTVGPRSASCVHGIRTNTQNLTLEPSDHGR